MHLGPSSLASGAPSSPQGTLSRLPSLYPTVSLGLPPNSPSAAAAAGSRLGAPVPCGRGGLSRAGALGNPEGANCLGVGGGRKPLCVPGVVSSHRSGPKFAEVLALSPSLVSVSVVGVELAAWGHLLSWAVLTHLLGQPLHPSPNLPGHLGATGGGQGSEVVCL